MDLWGAPGEDPSGFYLGIDVGSTSTKALMLTAGGKPFAGFYTYTSGQPLKAVQALFEAIRAAARGETLLPSAVVDKVVARLACAGGDNVARN